MEEASLEQLPQCCVFFLEQEEGEGERTQEKTRFKVKKVGSALKDQGLIETGLWGGGGMEKWFWYSL